MQRFKFLFVATFAFITAAAVSSLKAEVTVEEVKEAVLKELRSGKSGADTNVFNPAIGVVLDSVYKNTTADQGDFQFRAAEMNFSASVDPFSRAYAIINGTEEGVEVEEAAVVTTRFLKGTQIRFGRYFANFGRFPKFHEHELPFVERLPSLETFVDGEAQAQGVELTYLLPLPFFLQITGGVTDKIGAENTRHEEDQGLNPGGTGHTEGRPGKAFTYNGRLFTFIPMGDDHGLDIGVSEAYTPYQKFVGGIEHRQEGSARTLLGGDLTYRYEPRSPGVIRKAIWGTEVFTNSERRRQELALDTDNDGTGDTDTFERRTVKGGYTYADAQVGQRFSGGGFFDVSRTLDYPDDLTKTKTYGAMVNFMPSEFQKIRLQLSKETDNQGTPQNKQVFVQWIATIGRHAHTFKDR